MSKLSVLALASAWTALVLVTGTAEGAILGGSAAIPWQNGDAACFQRSWSKIRSVGCTNGKLLMLPLPLRTAGYKTFTAQATGASTGTLHFIDCSVTVNSADGSQTWFSGWQGTYSTQIQLHTLNMGSRTLYAGETAQIECRLDAYGWFNPGTGGAYGPELINVAWTD